MATIIRYKDENGKWVSLPSIRGEKGEKGETGDNGDPGPSYDDSEIKADIQSIKAELLGVDALIGEVTEDGN